MMEVGIGLVIGLLVLVGIVSVSMGNKEDLARLQQLKNKRRFSGKRLPPAEMQEFERLSRKYWWY